MSGLDESLEERKTRAARNESIFRALNAEMDNLNTSFKVGNGEFTIICECCDMKCVDQIQIASADYARVRTDSRLFLVVPGHEVPTVESVVEQDNAFVVVRKPPGLPAEIAAEAAPE